MSEKEQVLNILFVGTIDSKPPTDSNIDASIDVLKNTARHDPETLLSCIIDAFEVKVDRMRAIALAILMTHADQRWLLKKRVANNIDILLSHYNPPKLLEIVELIKSRWLGCGLGSNVQKRIRYTMERWDADALNIFFTENKHALIHLMKIIHPRYCDDARISVLQKYKHNKAILH